MVLKLKLQKVNNEGLNGLTGDDAEPDIRAPGVWRQGQCAFFDISLTNTIARSQKHLPVSAILSLYNSRIMNVEHGTFVPLVFSLTGGEGPETYMFHKHIAQKVANKMEEKYEKVQTLIRCKLPFLILRSVLLCIRESRSLMCSAAGLFQFGHRN